MRSKIHKRYDPLVGHLVTESETSSTRIQIKFRNPYHWCFCELCWRTTEYATAIEAQTIFKQTRDNGVRAIPLSEPIRMEAQRDADFLVERYEQALGGAYGPYEVAQMLMTYCDPIEMRGDRSAEAFRDQVERLMLILAWGRHGNLLSTPRLPNQPEGAAKPSKLYCEMHNQRRSDQARRAYQRDRRFAAEYQALISACWSGAVGRLPTWDIEVHAAIRKAAYYKLLHLKKPTLFIDELKAQGIDSQAEISRILGISPAAVSAAIKRHSTKPSSVGNVQIAWLWVMPPVAGVDKI